jgi:hypothetical protein
MKTAVRSILLLSALALVSLGIVAFAQPQLAQPQPRNLSQGRGLGIGLQGPCMISIRYWMDEKLGLEGNFLFLTDQICLSGRLLFRLGDTSNFDLYGSLGGWYLSSPYDQGLRAFALAGMELSISPNFALNLEFGEWLGTDRRYEVMVSSGIHFYFLK